MIAIIATALPPPQFSVRAITYRFDIELEFQAVALSLSAFVLLTYIKERTL